MTPCDQSPDCLHTPCVDCGRPIRLLSQKIADHPGTIIGYVTRRLCDTHDKHRRVTPRHGTHIDQARHENNIAGLNKFMARIRGTSRLKVTR
jgi:hypothetical protein